jgi:hypothetical protein
VFSLSIYALAYLTVHTANGCHMQLSLIGVHGDAPTPSRSLGLLRLRMRCLSIP